MQRSGRSGPDLVQALIAARERAELRHGPHQRHGADRLQTQHPLRDQIHAHKTKPGIAQLARAEPRQFHHVVANRMIVTGAPLAEFRHGLGGRLAETDTHLEPLLARPARGELHAAVQFAAEVHQQ